MATNFIQAQTPQSGATNNNTDIAINPNDFNGDFKNLLTEIQNVSGDLLKGDIAKYAGYKDNGVFDPNNQPLRSIDKLTFLIMFRLPLSSQVTSTNGTNQYYGDPFTGNSWTKRANDYRSLNNLNKLDFSGEEVDSSGKKLIDWTSEAGYNKISGLWPKIYKENGTELVHQGDGSQNGKRCKKMADGSFQNFDTTNITNEYKDQLFDSTVNYNKLPVSFFRMAQDENPYVNYYKTQKNYKMHWPEIFHSNDKDGPLSRKVWLRRKLKVTSTNLLPSQTGLLHNKTIQSTSGTYFIAVNTGNIANVTVELDDANISNDPKFSNLTGLDCIKDGNDLFAIISNSNAMCYDPSEQSGVLNTKRYVVSLYNIENHPGWSGLTLGAGIDLGAAFVLSYIAPSVWQLTATPVSGTFVPFNLCLGTMSVQVNPQTLETQLKSKTTTLLTSFLNQSSAEKAHHLNKTILGDSISSRIKVTKIRDTNLIKEYNLTINFSHTFFEPDTLFVSGDGINIVDTSQYKTGDSFETSYDFPVASNYQDTVAAYKSNKIYKVDDLVSHRTGQISKVYKCISETNNIAPNSLNGSTYWQTVNHALNDLILYNAALYKCIQATQGELPVTNNDPQQPVTDVFWDKVTIRAEYKKAIDILHKILIKSFDPTKNITKAELYNVLQIAGVPSGLNNLPDRRDEFLNLVKASIGVKFAKSWVHFRNHYDLIRTFQLPSKEGFPRHLRALYNEFFIPEYTVPALKTLRENGLQAIPNEIEKYVLYSCQYNKGSVKEPKKLASVINSHSYAGLIEYVKLVWAGNREEDILNFVENTGYRRSDFETNLCVLYKNLE